MPGINHQNKVKITIPTAAAVALCFARITTDDDETELESDSLIARGMAKDVLCPLMVHNKEAVQGHGSEVWQDEGD